MTTPADILDEVRSQLFDPSPGVGWSDPELLGYLDEALKASANAKADFYVVQATVTLSAGILQQIPADGVSFMDATYNTATNRVVTQVDKALLEEANRFWPAATQQAEVENYTFDPRYPRLFVVFPPNDGTGSISLTYGAVPPLPATDTDLAVSDNFVPPLVDFVLSRAWDKGSKRRDPAKAQYHRQMWATALGLRSQSQIAVSPRTSQSPGA